jgi:hypothetical protein
VDVISLSVGDHKHWGDIDLVSFFDHDLRLMMIMSGFRTITPNLYIFKDGVVILTKISLKI